MTRPSSGPRACSRISCLSKCDRIQNRAKTLWTNFPHRWCDVMWPHENRACDSNRSKSSVFWACVNKCMIYIAPIWGPCATVMAYSNCWMNSTPKIHQALSHKECKKLKATKDTPQSHIKFLSKNFLIPYPSLSHHQIFPKMPTTRSLIGHSFAHARSSSTAVRCLFGPGPFGAVNPSCGGGGYSSGGADDRYYAYLEVIYPQICGTFHEHEALVF